MKGTRELLLMSKTGQKVTLSGHEAGQVPMSPRAHAHAIAWKRENVMTDSNTPIRDAALRDFIASRNTPATKET